MDKRKDMNESIKEVLPEFKEGLKSILGEKFVDLILFGSYAREDYSAGSDIDLLLVVKDKLSLEEREKISDFSSNLSLEHDTVITCFDYPYDDFKHRNTPFLLNIRREGITI